MRTVKEAYDRDTANRRLLAYGRGYRDGQEQRQSEQLDIAPELRRAYVQGYSDGNAIRETEE